MTVARVIFDQCTDGASPNYDVHDAIGILLLSYDPFVWSNLASPTFTVPWFELTGTKEEISKHLETIITQLVLTIDHPLAINIVQATEVSAPLVKVVGIEKIKIGVFGYVNQSVFESLHEPQLIEWNDRSKRGPYDPQFWVTNAWETLFKNQSRLMKNLAVLEVMKS